MILKEIFPALIGATLLVMGGASMAADYRADEFLGLDLSKAVLSPKRLGPPAEFVPVPREARDEIAKSDTAKTETAKTETAKTEATKTGTTRSNAPKSDVATTEPAQPRSERRAISHARTAIAHARIETPRGAARTRLAHRHGNPLDAQARDTRIQAPRIQAPRIQTPRIQTPRIQTWPCNSGGICDWKQ